MSCGSFKNMIVNIFVRSGLHVNTTLVLNTCTENKLVPLLLNQK